MIYFLAALWDKIMTSGQLLEVVEIVVHAHSGQLKSVKLKIGSSIRALFLASLNTPLIFTLVSADFFLN